MNAKGHEGSERKIWKTAEKMESVWGLLILILQNGYPSGLLLNLVKFLKIPNFLL